MLGSLFDRDARAVDVSAWARGDDSTFYPVGGSAAGQTVTTDTSLQLLAVYGCTGLISDVISTLPAGVFRAKADSVTSPLWIKQPNPETDWVTFVIQVVLSWLLDGNAYIAVSRFGSSVRELWVLDPAKVEVSRPYGGGKRVYKINGQTWPGELLHVPATQRPGALKGMSPIEAARQSIGLGLGALEYGAKFFANGASLSGVIEVPGKLQMEEAKFLKRNWMKAHSGSAKAHEPGVLTEGAKWSPVSITNEQAQFLATRQYTAAEIAGQLYRVDPTMLGIPVESKGAITYQNIEQRGVHLVQFTLLPWIVRLENLVSALLGPTEYLKLNVAGLLRADLKTRYESYSIGLGNTGGVPFLTVDEVRDLEERQPFGGDYAMPQHESSSRELSTAEILQKVYLAVTSDPPILSADEARVIAGLVGDAPEPDPAPDPAPPQFNINVDANTEIREGAVQVSTPVDIDQSQHESHPTEVTVEPTPIVVQNAAPVVNVDQRRTEKVIHRDANGLVERVEERPVDD